LPENIWLEEINLKGNSFNFVGYAVRGKDDYLASIQEFIRNLKKEKFAGIFKNISLKNSRKNYLSGTEVMRFEVECKN
jgi:Tfp pilus assembly protein PilN